MAVVLLAVLAIIVVGKLGFSGPLPVIQVPPEPLANIGGFVLTNTITAGWMTVLVVFLIFRAATTNMQMVPRGIQNLIEFVVEAFLGLVNNIAGERYARTFFPLLGSVFFFVLFNAWLGLLPGYGTIGIVEHPHNPEHHPVPFTKIGPIAVMLPGAQPIVNPAPADDHAAPADEHAAPSGTVEGVLVPFLRAANTDLNTPLALALVTFLFVEFWGIRANGLGYFKKFLNFSGPIPFFVGLLETISEFVRIVSFTFRLFGNMFAGEVLLAVIVFLVPWGLVVVFYGLELFVGLVQALVFAALNLVFVTMAVAGHHDGGDHAEAAGHGAAERAAPAHH